MITAIVILANVEKSVHSKLITVGRAMWMDIIVMTIIIACHMERVTPARIV